MTPQDVVWGQIPAVSTLCKTSVFIGDAQVLSFYQLFPHNQRLPSGPMGGRSKRSAGLVWAQRVGSPSSIDCVRLIKWGRTGRQWFCPLLPKH